MSDLYNFADNRTCTENGAQTYLSTHSRCLDLFATIGAIRRASENTVIDRFLRAFTEDADTAMKILFFGRDVRGGLGERRVFRVILRWLAQYAPNSLEKNLALIPEYGRYDDLLVLMDTPCWESALALIAGQLENDLQEDTQVSLLAKWLPSVNASNGDTVRRAKKLARSLGMTDAQYRKTLVALRAKIDILENRLRERDYTFDYARQPSKAMFQYRRAFLRNDETRYSAYLEQVQKGEAVLHAGTLAPYEIIAPCFQTHWPRRKPSPAQSKVMDVTWNALEDFGGEENALVVVDGSGSMYMSQGPKPITVALSLGIYFAQRNRGPFQNRFITFSENPQLVEIQGEDIAEKVLYCASFTEAANTDLEKVFGLILQTAVQHRLAQEALPAKLYIVTDMEFDCCTANADLTNFQAAQMLFARHGYRLPDVVFWNVNSRCRQQPVTKNQQGVALVSGCTPRLFSLVAGGLASPYTMMMDILQTERYAKISA